MKYAIIQVSNGNYRIVAEGYTNLDSAKVKYHSTCSALWNASDVETAAVMIVDQNLNCVEGYREFISKAPATQ